MGLVHKENQLGHLPLQGLPQADLHALAVTAVALGLLALYI